MLVLTTSLSSCSPLSGLILSPDSPRWPMPCSAELPRAIVGHRIRGEPDGGATSPLGRQHRTYPDTRRTAFATWTISQASCLSTACCSLLWFSTLAGAIGPTAFFDVDIDRAVVLLRAGWDRHWRPGAPAIAPSTRHRGGREECWSSEGPHWSGSTRPRFTTPKDSDPLTPSYGRPESHRGTPHSLGWLPKSSVLFAAVPAVRGLVVFPVRPFATLPRWALSSTVGTGLRTLWSIFHAVIAADESRLARARPRPRAALSCGTRRRSRSSDSLRD